MKRMLSWEVAGTSPLLRRGCTSSVGEKRTGYSRGVPVLAAQCPRGLRNLESACPAKRLELISELVPNAKVIALLVNPNSPQTERVVRAMQEAARVRGVKLEVLKAATESEIETAFASLARLKTGALVQQADPFFLNRRDQFALLAARHAIPAIYEARQFAEAGGATWQGYAGNGQLTSFRQF
jgi:ABC transporter substrate binding protein